MNAIRTKTVKTADGWAALLPLELGIDSEMEVMIQRSGKALVVEPVETPMAKLVRELRELPRPAFIEEREPFEFPDRPGL